MNRAEAKKKIVLLEAENSIYLFESNILSAIIQIKPRPEIDSLIDEAINHLVTLTEIVGEDFVIDYGLKFNDLRSQLDENLESLKMIQSFNPMLYADMSDEVLNLKQHSGRSGPNV